MWEPDADCGSGETNPSFWKQMLYIGGCLAYHTEIIKRTSTCGNRSISSPDIRNFYCQPPSVVSYHRSAMSAVTIRCQNHATENSSLYDSRCRWRPRKSWRDNMKACTGQSLSSLLRIADDRSPWMTWPLQRRRRSEYPSDAWVPVIYNLKSAWANC